MRAQNSIAWITQLLVFGTVAGLTSGCAGRMTKVETTEDVSSAVGQNYADQFAVKEVGAPESTPVVEAPQVAVTAPSPTPEIKIEVKEPNGKKKKIKTPGISDKATTPATAASSTAPQPAAPAQKSPQEKPFALRSIRPSYDPYPVGETLTLEVSYFGVAGGYITFESLPHKQVNGREVYDIKAHAQSSRVFSLFYKLDDSLESFIDTLGFFSHRFQMEIDETFQSRSVLELYDSEKQTTFFWARWNQRNRGTGEAKDTKPMPRYPQDFISCIYYLRAIPLNIGEDIRFPFMQEGRMTEASVLVLRKDVISTFLGETPVYVLRPTTYRDGIRQQKEDSFLYLTADDRRLPVRLEAKVRVGTVSARLVEMKR